MKIYVMSLSLCFSLLFTHSAFGKLPIGWTGTIQPCPHSVDYIDPYTGHSLGQLRRGNLFYYRGHQNGGRREFIASDDTIKYPSGKEFRGSYGQVFYYPIEASSGWDRRIKIQSGEKLYFPNGKEFYDRGTYYYSEKFMQAIARQTSYFHLSGRTACHASSSSAMLYADAHDVTPIEEGQIRLQTFIQDKHGDIFGDLEITLTRWNERTKVRFDLDLSGLFDKSLVILEPLDSGETLLDSRFLIPTGRRGEYVRVILNSGRVQSVEKLVNAYPMQNPGPGPYPPNPPGPYPPPPPHHPPIEIVVRGTYGQARVNLHSVTAQQGERIVMAIRRALDFQMPRD